MSSEFYFGLKVGAIFGAALVVLALGLLIKPTALDRIADEEQMQALRDKGIL